MAMIAGTCTMTVTASGTVYSASYTGSGMSLTLIQARGPTLLAQMNAALATVVAATQPPSPPLTSISATMLSGAQAAATNLATETQALASGLVTYVAANAVATISTSLGGLQTSAASGSPTTAPSVAHTIPIS